jgi:small conductance mechanosensitive channel
MASLSWIQAAMLGLMSADAPALQPGSAVAQVETKVEGWVEHGISLLTEYGMHVVGALVFLGAAWIGSRWLVRLIVRGLTRAHVDVTLAKFLSDLARWVLLVLVIIACLSIFGIPITGFVTVLGTAGLAIGLALQGSLSHMAAGVMLMLFRPFRVGDSVVVAGQRGVVDEIELFTTRLDTPDKRRIIIPNGQVFGAIIENLTHHDDRRVDANVGVSYGADIERTRQVLTDAAMSVVGRIPERPADVNMLQLGATTVDWQVVIWTNAANAGAAKQALLKTIKEGLDQAGIPYPQRAPAARP